MIDGELGQHETGLWLTVRFFGLLACFPRSSDIYSLVFFSSPLDVYHFLPSLLYVLLLHRSGLRSRHSRFELLVM